MEIIEKKMPVDKRMERPEQRVEKRSEQALVKVEERQTEQTEATAAPAISAPPIRDEELVMIESILP